MDDALSLTSNVHPVLLGVWREACRNVDLNVSAAAITELLGQCLPLQGWLVRRIETSRSALETVVVGGLGSGAEPGAGRSECPVPEFRALLQWAGEGKVVRLSAAVLDDALSPARIAVPAGADEDVDFLVGPLHDAEGPAGVLILIAQRGRRFDAQHAAAAQGLLDPFSAALEIDGRLRDVAAMRAAAEADKLSLLTKLGRKQLGDVLVGADSGLRGVMERAELVARSDVPVLILGETGTGKEVVARLIHNRSPRAAGPFLRVNCGAIPMELVDSQLFGHERGAFTGAVEARQGWFERADGGTLLLDEVGELPLAAQVRLLRILQDGWLERVGGHQPIHVQVRVVAATHRDLAAMVKAGTFREDLWYRLAVFPISLPPLRQRCEDIPALARHFAERAAARFVLPPVMPTAEDIRLLLAYPWPGNIRELAAVIDRAAILGDGQRLEVAKALGTPHHPVAEAALTALPTAAPAEPTFPSLDEAMKRHIEAALEKCHGRVEGRRGAAALLKINPHTLRARMRKLKIDWARYREED